MYHKNFLFCTNNSNNNTRAHNSHFLFCTVVNKSNRGATDEDEEAIEKELGNAQTAQQLKDEADELEAKEQVVKGNLIGSFGDLISSVCNNSTGGYVDPLLRSSAVLALSKMMCISAHFWYVYF